MRPIISYFTFIFYSKLQKTENFSLEVKEKEKKEEEVVQNRNLNRTFSPFFSSHYSIFLMNVPIQKPSRSALEAYIR